MNTLDSVRTSDIVISNNKRDFKYMRLLAMIYVTFLMAATVMAYKIVNLGGVSEPGSTLIYTATFFLSNVFAELYGANYTKKLIWESIISGYIFAFLITIVNCIPSPGYWNKYQEFHVVLGHVLRFTNAGVIGYLLSSFLNTYLLTTWKYKLKGRYFWIRSLLASSISESCATFIAGILNFLGMISTKYIFIVMFHALLFKIIYGFFAVWPATFLVYLIKKKEININDNRFINSPYIKG